MYLCNPGVFHVNIRIASCFPILYIFRKEYFFHFTKDMKLKHFVISQPFSPEFLIFKKRSHDGIVRKQIWELSKVLLRRKINFPRRNFTTHFCSGISLHTDEELRLSRIKPDESKKTRDIYKTQINHAFQTWKDSR